MDLFASLSSADRAKARRTVLQAILATEMGKHFDHVNELLRRAETDEPFDACVALPSSQHPSRLGRATLVGRTPTAFAP